MSRRISAALVGLLLAVSLAACGSSDSGTDASSATAEAAKPTAIVSLSPSATETLFAIGAGDQVIAVDKNSNYPADAPKGDLDAYKPNVEAIAAKKPDLVVVSDDVNDVVAGLKALRIPVLLQTAPTDLDGVYAEIDELGTATGHVPEARRLRAKMKAQINHLVSSGGDIKGLTYYYELDNTYYSQTSHTFLGGVLGQLGLVNIADDADASSDYPQLSAEHIIKKNPDLILLADTKCCQQSLDTVRSRPGWSGLKALTTGGVVLLDDDIASRWGPRLVDLVRMVENAARKVKAAG